jgi:pyrimidine-nucleoside phosphorylase
VGNALEIAEAIEVLQGKGPGDTRELTVCLGAEMLLLSGLGHSEATARTAIKNALDDGRALALFRKMIALQGGDPRVCDDAGKFLPQAPGRVTVFARRHGYVTAIDSRSVGLSAQRLGAGRQRYDDCVDPAVGVVVHVSPGDAVSVGQPIAQLHHANRGLHAAVSILEDAFAIGDSPPHALPIVIEILK